MLLITLLLASSLARNVHPNVSIIEAQTHIIPLLSTPHERRPLRLIPRAKKFRLWKKDKHGIIYDTEIKTNHFGHRVTRSDLASPKSKPDSHLILSGCSVTFGEGVADGETFPYLLSEAFPTDQVVNTGIRGSSPLEHIYLWRTVDYRQIISPTDGVMIFTIIPDHFARIARSWRFLYWGFADSVDFDFSQKPPQILGVLGDRWDYQLSQAIQRMGLSYWWLRLTNLHSEWLVRASIPTVVQALKELELSYLAQFPKGKFFVSWMRKPLLSEEEDYLTFLSELKKHKISFWDQSWKDPALAESIAKDKWHIPRDGHPTKDAHQAYFRFLESQLKQLQR